MSSKQFYTPNEVAQLLMVSPVTVRQWAQKGKLQAATTMGGHRRFELAEIQRFARENNITLQSNEDDKLRILVVDDDEQLSGFMQEFLQANLPKTDIRIAFNGFSAGLLIKSFKPDVVLLDLMMPGINGFEVCHAIKNDSGTKSTKIIAMSGFLSDENKERIQNAGAELCLEKPLMGNKLLEYISSSFPAKAQPAVG